MPNHIKVSIQIPDVSKSQFDNFIDSISSVRRDWYGKQRSQIDFYKIIPSSDGEDWYEAHLKDWGTKWNAMLSECEWNHGTGHIYFETAWNTPDPILKMIVRDDWTVYWRDEMWDDSAPSQQWTLESSYGNL